jgi:hypothetical protein
MLAFLPLFIVKLLLLNFELFLSLFFSSALGFPKIFDIFFCWLQPGVFVYFLQQLKLLGKLILNLLQNVNRIFA